MTRRALRGLRKSFSRRRALQGLGAAVGAGLVGCTGEGASDDEGTSGAEAEGTSSGDGTATTGADASSSSGGSSESSTGDSPPVSDCSAASELDAAALLAPIEHIVVVMMENRSFDHMLGALALEGRTIDGLTGRESNPDSAGDPVVVYPLEDPAIQWDPPHSWESSHLQWNDGANDGFVSEAAGHFAPDAKVVMGYYDRATLPVSYALADSYSVCDRWFSSVLGPTWPNRYCLHLGSSYGVGDNVAIEGEVVSIFDRLTEHGVTNLYYSSNLPFTATYGKSEGVLPISDFFDAAEAGTLPQFCMVEPLLTFGNTVGHDDHPPADVGSGQAFLATVYEALAQSSLWDRCLLVIVYDEHGGFHDHVPPPTTVDDFPGFEQLGIRVPALVIGPHVRRGCVSSMQFDHVSVVATATRRWGLVPLNARVEATNDLSSCIDPSFIDDPQPPAPVPKMVMKRPQVRAESTRSGGQTELAALADAGGVPPEQDRRAHTEQTMAMILALGERLGVLELVD